MIAKVTKHFFSVWILFTNYTCFWVLKGEKTSYKTAFVSCIESDSCIIVFLKVLSKTSKGRYLDFKRASFASQKGVNRKPIYALFVFKIRFFFTKFILLSKTIEKRIRWKCAKCKVLLLPCIQAIQSLFFCYFVFSLFCLQTTG